MIQATKNDMLSDMFYFEYEEEKLKTGFPTKTARKVEGTMVANEYQIQRKDDSTCTAIVSRDYEHGCLLWTETVSGDVLREYQVNGWKHKPPFKFPVKTVYVRELGLGESADYARSTVICGDSDFPPNKNVGRFLAQFYLEKELLRLDMKNQVNEYRSDNVETLNKVFNWEKMSGEEMEERKTYREVKRTLKDNENGPAILKELDEGIKEIIFKYNRDFYLNMVNFAQEIDIFTHPVVQETLKGKSKIRYKVKDSGVKEKGKKVPHVKFFGEKDLTELEKKHFLYQKEENKE